MACDEFVEATDGKFRGVGTLLLPGGKVARGNESAACQGCEWRTAPERILAGRFGFRSRPCGEGEVEDVQHVVYFRPSPTSAWEPVTDYCPADGEPVDAAEFDRLVRDPFEKMVPRQRAGVQPQSRALIYVPSIFYAGQPATSTTTLRVLGRDVTITAEATFTWNFGDGTVETHTTPGGRYPNKDVTHPYEALGTYPVSLTTRWRGTYRVNGGDAIPIAGTIGQTTEVAEITVVESRPQLVAPD